MLSRMPGTVWYEWLAYDSLEPVGDPRADLRIGHQTAILINAMRAKGKPSVRISETTISFKRPEKQTWKEQLAFVEALNEALGGEDLRDEEKRGWRD